MSKLYRLSDARVETVSARDRHLALLSDVRKHCITANVAKDKFMYLLAIPMIYAAWEGYFKLVCSLCVKRKCQVGKKTKAYEPMYSTLWLQKEPFVQSYLQSLINSMQPGRATRASFAQYEALTAFAGSVTDWMDEPVNHALDFESLVMTYSNVGRDVVKTNARAIDMDLTGVALGKLDELLGRRNGIAHGGLMSYPLESEVVEYIDYAELLLTTFNAAVQRWLPTV